MKDQKSERKKVFVSYSHKAEDRTYFDELLVHLKAMEREREISIWSDTMIKPGKWPEEIEQVIMEAKVAVLLISADFLASDFIRDVELPMLLEAAEKDEATIIPVILRPSGFTRIESLSQFQSPNPGLTPLSKIRARSKREDVYVKLTEMIKEVFEPQSATKTRKRSTARSAGSVDDRTPPQDKEVDKQSRRAGGRRGPRRAKTITDQNASRVELLRTLTDLGGAIESVACSPDGKWLAAGSSSDQTVQVWQVANWKALRPLQNLPSDVTGVAFAPDNASILACATMDGTIQMWEIPSGARLGTFLDPESLQAYVGQNEVFIRGIAFSPNAPMLAVAANGEMVLLLDTSDATFIHKLKKTWSPFSICLAFSPDGAILAVGSHFNLVRLWRVSDGELLGSLEGPYDLKNLLNTPGRVWSVAYSPDGLKLAAASSDHTVRLWSVSDRMLEMTFDEYTDQVVSVAFSPDGKILATASHDEKVMLWRVADGALLRDLPARSPLSLCFSPDGAYLIAGSEDQGVHVFGIK
jgi:WD40 repeat protein